MSARLGPSELDELKARLRDQCEDVATALLGEPVIRTPKEWRWGSRNGSLALCVSGSRRGLWVDRALAKANGRYVGGDMLQLIRHQTGCSFGAAPPSRSAKCGWFASSALPHEGHPDRTSLLAAADALSRLGVIP
jgi:hypothetical protein